MGTAFFFVFLTFMFLSQVVGSFFSLAMISLPALNVRIVVLIWPPLIFLFIGYEILYF